MKSAAAGGTAGPSATLGRFGIGGLVPGEALSDAAETLGLRCWTEPTGAAPVTSTPGGAPAAVLAGGASPANALSDSASRYDGGTSGVARTPLTAESGVSNLGTAAANTMAARVTKTIERSTELTGDDPPTRWRWTLLRAATSSIHPKITTGTTVSITTAVMSPHARAGPEPLMRTRAMTMAAGCQR